MTKKTDLASLRGLKAIARRKMNQNYWDIPEPAEHIKKYDEARKLYDKELKEQILLLAGKMKPADMKELVMEACLMANHPYSSGSFRTKAVMVVGRKAKEALAKKGIKVPSCESYGKQLVEKARLLFNEIESAELQIIAGESVDLAKFVRKLEAI